ncbi:predicted protein [Histoplasma capsulatum H143]|uniref:Uncharacterized protein n=1 Tax=Ajellomyces capsulatus (strain H143) TaxID=544712 RepID=C6HHC1_AJECH|nr:predicted protein [Histoplasma capsulatum H143]
MAVRIVRALLGGWENECLCVVQGNPATCFEVIIFLLSKTRRDLEQKIEVESATSGFNYCPSLDPQSSLKLPYTAHVRVELYEQPSKDPEQSQGKLRWDEPNMVNYAKCLLGSTLEDLLVAIMEYQ